MQGMLDFLNAILRSDIWSGVAVLLRIAFLFLVIWLRSRENPLKLALKTGLPAAIGGLSLVADILSGLDAKMAEAGYTSLAQAVGTGRKDWV